MVDNEKGMYEVYLYRHDSNTDYKTLEGRLSLLDNDTRISIRDISDEDSDEKVRTLNSILNLNRCRRYDSEQDLPSYVDVIRLSGDKYLSMVSICRNILGEKKAGDILHAMFSSIRIEYFHSANSKEVCAQYWSRMFNSVPITGNKEKNAVYKIEGEDTFEITIENKKRYSELFENNPTSLKAMISKAISKVMCHVTQKHSVIGQDIHDHGSLERIPIYMDDSNNDKAISAISSYLNDVDRYDNISYDEVNSFCNFDLDMASMYTQLIVYEERFRDMFKSMQVNTVYKLPTISYINCPMNIVADIKRNTIAVHYFYDKLYFDNFSIEGLHNSIAKLVSCYLDDVYIDIGIDRLIAKKNDVDKKVLEAKISILKKLEGFKEISDGDISKLAMKCGVVRRFSEQCVVAEGQHPRNIYIIVKGRIAVECRDSDNYIHSLMILKDRNILGIESLIDARKSKVDYRVVGDDVTMVTIGADVFWEYALRYPALVKNMLEIQTDRLERFQKLWSMT